MIRPEHKHELAPQTSPPGQPLPLATRMGRYAILSSATGVGYFGSQWFPIRNPVTFSATTVDRLIPFQSGWSWIYQTVYIVVPLVALSIPRKNHFDSYVRGYWLMLSTCLLCFWLYPVYSPRPADLSPNSLDPMHALILSYDGIINCFPSLHVALGLFSILHGMAILRARGVHQRWLSVSMFLWMILMCYSTVALKQHYVVDVPAGIVVALVAFCIFRPSYA